MSNFSQYCFDVYPERFTWINNSIHKLFVQYADKKNSSISLKLSNRIHSFLIFLIADLNIRQDKEAELREFALIIELIVLARGLHTNNNYLFSISKDYLNKHIPLDWRILIGDYLLSVAYKRLLNCNDTSLISNFFDSAQKTSEGELLYLSEALKKPGKIFNLRVLPTFMLSLDINRHLFGKSSHRNFHYLLTKRIAMEYYRQEFSLANDVENNILNNKLISEFETQYSITEVFKTHGNVIENFLSI